MNKISSRWPCQVFSSSFTTHARGIIILIHKSIPFELNNKYLDPAGRFVILSGTIISTLVNFVCLYAPNGDDPAFYHDLFLTMSAYNGPFIIGGDFNCVLNPAVDHSNSSVISQQKTSRTIEKYMKDINLVEVWRRLYPNKTEYSCFSSTFKTYSQIDFFLVSSVLLSTFQKSWYEAIPLSDHAPVILITKLLPVFNPISISS